MRIIKQSLLWVLLAGYGFLLIKIILFKFRAVDLIFLLHRLKRNLETPSYMKRQLMEEGNLIPFKQIGRTVLELSHNDMVNFFGNLAIFMPYGILLALLAGNKRISPLAVYLHALAVSLCLETAQVVLTMGRFDVDDLILNSAGGLLGCLAFRFYAHAGDKRETLSLRKEQNA